MDKHTFYLIELCRFINLKKLGIDTKKISVVFLEPTCHDAILDKQMPDIIIAMKSGNWIVIELKGNKGKRDKAKAQIFSGFNMLNKLFNIPLSNMVGKFVVYDSRKGYSFETVYPDYLLGRHDTRLQAFFDFYENET